jgi:hypothetical protein
MSTLTVTPTASFSEKPTIDEREGIIYGVSIITAGDISGHRMKADQKTLETCLAAFKSHKDGVLCKGDHGTGIFEALGTFKNPRIDGNKLRGDLHLFKAHPHFQTVIEVARRMPHSMGMSISFSYAPEIINEEVHVRVKSLFSIDLVDSPAANPTGMFSKPKTQCDTTKLAACYLAAFGQDQFNAVVSHHGGDAYSVMERGLYFSGLTIPNYDFSRAAQFGAPKAAWGTRRGEVAAQQERINNCLQRLK